MAETPEQRYERLRETVQDTILRNFPNPARKGCPGDRVVREVAGRRDLVEDDPWQHITHCSPCYGTFLQFKEEFRVLRRRRGVGIMLAGIVAVLGSGIAVYEMNGRGEQAPMQTAANYEAATLDLGSTSQRGSEARPGGAATLFLPRKKLSLTIILPFGSEPGKYQVQLRRSGQELVTVEANAEVRGGNTELRVELNLSTYAPGIYAVAIRQPKSTWVENPLTLS